jgi:hypothetical protein
MIQSALLIFSNNEVVFCEVVMFKSMRAKAKIAEDFKTFDNSQLNQDIKLKLWR